MKNKIIALMYDFDHTLATDDMQNFSFIPSLKITSKEFWALTNDFSEKYNIDRVLSYMYVMIKEAKKQNITVTKEWLKKQGKNITFFKGVLDWFKRINEYGASKGFKVEHYLITSGNSEIVEGSKIAKEFAHIFGCEFVFDPKTKEAIWPANMVNYTQKTQYFFKISKGVYKNSEDNKVNEKTPIRRILYRNMIYYGDGLTDVPIMILIKEKGGKSIAVYKDRNMKKVEELLMNDRVNFICPADYSKGKDLELITKSIIDEMVAKDLLAQKKEKMMDKHGLLSNTSSRE